MMRSAQYEVGGPEKITVGQVNIPSIRNNEILIKVFASAINRADTLQVSSVMLTRMLIYLYLALHPKY